MNDNPDGRNGYGSIDGQIGYFRRTLWERWDRLEAEARVASIQQALADVRAVLERIERKLGGLP